MNILELTCAECGVKFTRKYRDVTRRCRFCSKVCSWKNWRKSDKYIEQNRLRKLNAKSQRQRNLEYYYRNKEKYRIYYKKNGRNKINRIYNTFKHNGAVKGSGTVIDFISFKDWYEKQDRVCHYCGIREDVWLKYLNNSRRKIYRLTIDRKDNSVGYCSWNICLACDTCNKVKNNVFTEEEMLEIGEKYMKPKWQKKLQEATIGG